MKKGSERVSTGFVLIPDFLLLPFQSKIIVIHERNNNREESCPKTIDDVVSHSQTISCEFFILPRFS